MNHELEILLCLQTLVALYAHEHDHRLITWVAGVGAVATALAAGIQGIGNLLALANA